MTQTPSPALASLCVQTADAAVGTDRLPEGPLWAASLWRWERMGGTPLLGLLGPDVSYLHRLFAAWRSSFPHTFIHPTAVRACVQSCY